MPKKLTLHPDDIPKLETAIERDERSEVRQRAAALRAVHLGQSVKEVAMVLAVTEPTVYGWLKRWREEGVEGLAHRPRVGRPRIADEQYCRALEEAIETDPHELGYRFSIWTVERLRDHLERTIGVHLSVKRLGEVILERGYVYRRPKHDLKNLQDPAAKEQAKQMLEELKRGRSKTISGFSLWTKRP